MRPTGFVFVRPGSTPLFMRQSLETDEGFGGTAPAPAATATAAAAAATSSSGGAGSGSGSVPGSSSGSDSAPSSNSSSGSGSNSNSGSSSGSSIPFGEPITKCRDQNAFALSFDDGPFQFTDTLLDTLQKNKLKATFFVNGKNFGNISDMASVLKRMLNEGHQIGSHTFDHKDLATLQEDAVGGEMTMLDNELLKIIKMTPVYMRPPFFSTNDLALGVLKRMQYHVVNADIDTKDFENTTPQTNDVAFENFKREFDKGGTISLMHDVHNTTVNQLIPNVVKFLATSNRKSMTVGECLGDPKENWYRAGGRGTGKAPAAAPAAAPKAGPANKPQNGKGGCGCGRKTKKGGGKSKGCLQGKSGSMSMA
ncbi:polysaccharide deacetylase family protein [Ophiocordyceps sinensis CO18]|uniref:Polysaccharide deacetylase family protein n=1 Tax=Ophiocordyceps sinensis (strain Co18 / CGMCC 3.14243) TaxID=911162 RepID=T5A5W2_OPHSC|nr:polysaccharide deacetylase family protein [Ophiocordyceps sinensis CO18]